MATIEKPSAVDNGPHDSLKHQTIKRSVYHLLVKREFDLSSHAELTRRADPDFSLTAEILSDPHGHPAYLPQIFENAQNAARLAISSRPDYEGSRLLHEIGIINRITDAGLEAGRRYTKANYADSEKLQIHSELMGFLFKVSQRRDIASHKDFPWQKAVDLAVSHPPRNLFYPRLGILKQAPDTIVSEAFQKQSKTGPTALGTLLIERHGARIDFSRNDTRREFIRLFDLMPSGSVGFGRDYFRWACVIERQTIPTYVQELEGTIPESFLNKLWAHVEDYYKNSLDLNQRKRFMNMSTVVAAEHVSPYILSAKPNRFWSVTYLFQEMFTTLSPNSEAELLADLKDWRRQFPLRQTPNVLIKFAPNLAEEIPQKEETLFRSLGTIFEKENPFDAF
jgi:hypothetical protein